MTGLKELIFADTQHYQGEVHPGFEDVAKQFSRLLQGSVDHGGAALAVYFQGDKVVDIYTGKKNNSEAWQADTLSVCYSTGKGVLATLAHILVSQGVLEYDRPVATYWPEFASHHKQDISLRQLLNHQSGLFDIRNTIEKARDMADWSFMLSKMQQMQPRFKPGSDSAYQALTFGWLVGGVLEKASGQSLAQLMQKYLLAPLALDGAYFGVPATELSRVALPCRKPDAGKVSASNVQGKKVNQIRKASFSERILELSG